MRIWHEEAYTRRDENGEPLSFVRDLARIAPWLTGRNVIDRVKRPSNAANGVSCRARRRPCIRSLGERNRHDDGNTDGRIGFFIDSYDLFIINLVQPIFAYL